MLVFQKPTGVELELDTNYHGGFAPHFLVYPPMLGRPEPTAYDLQFSLFNIPVRVSIWFWLFAALIGFDYSKMGTDYLLAWVMVVFLSILIHELGHALFLKWYGDDPWIVLLPFGGYAASYGFERHSTLRTVIMLLAGPGAGFLLAGATFGLAMAFSGSLTQLMVNVADMLIIVNIVWGLFNLLPVFPLDGGRVCQQLFRWMSPRSGDRYAFTLSCIVSAMIGTLAIVNSYFIVGLFFGMFFMQNYTALQSLRRW